MKKNHKALWIGLGALVVIGGGVGLYEYEKHKALQITAGGTGTLTVAPGTQTVSFTGTGDTLSIALPAGASWTSGSFAGITVPASGNTILSLPLVASASGTLNWTDSSGKAQTTTINVTKTG